MKSYLKIQLFFVLLLSACIYSLVVPMNNEKETKEQYKILDELTIKKILAGPVFVAAQCIKDADKNGMTMETFFKHVTEKDIIRITIEYNECAEIFLKHCAPIYFERIGKNNTELRKVFIDAVTQDNFIDINKNDPTLYFLLKNCIDKMLAQKFASYINTNTIGKVRGHLFQLILKTDAFFALDMAKKYITEDNIEANINNNNVKNLIEADSLCAGIIAKNTINSNNISDLFLDIHLFCKADKSLIKYFSQLINATNFDCAGFTIGKLVSEDSSLAKIFAQLILDTPQLQINTCLWTINYLIKADSSMIKILAKVLFDAARTINKDNIFYYFEVVTTLVLADESFIKTFAGLINQKNIKENELTFENLINKDASSAKVFAQLAVNDQLIAKNTIQDYENMIFDLIQVDASLALFFAEACIDANNLSKIPIKILIGLAKANKKAAEYIKNIKGFDKFFVTKDIDNDPLEIMIFGSEETKRDTFKNELAKICGVRTASHLSVPGIRTKKGQSWQHFIINYTDVIEKHAKDLKDKQLCQALFRMLNREWREQEKGRYVLYHAQSMNIAFSNMIYTRLLELYYGKPIDRKTFFAQRCNLPGQNLPYEQLQNLVKNGEQQLDNPNYKYMQFTNVSLFGNTNQSLDCSFLFLTCNKNYSSHDFEHEELFKQFRLAKYYKEYEYVFDKLKELVSQCKKGIMLMYSFTPEALNEFVFATQGAYGYKMKYGEKGKIIIDGKNAIDSSAQEIMDTLRNNPESFGFNSSGCNSSDFHQYVVLISDDHPTDTKKLGSCNPFNKAMRCYHIAVDHQVQLIEQILDKLFAKIQDDIKNDKTVFLQKNGKGTIQSKL